MTYQKAIIKLLEQSVELQFCDEEEFDEKQSNFFTNIAKLNKMMTDDLRQNPDYSELSEYSKLYRQLMKA